MASDVIASVRETLEYSWEVITRAYNAIMEFIGFFEDAANK